MSLAAGAMMIGGNLMEAYGQYSAGKQAKWRSQYEAEQMRTNAGQAIAASQRAAEEVARQGRLEQSRALAVAAASGGGVNDPTIVNLMGVLAGETQYRKMVALYEGQTAANQMLAGADVAAYEGRQALKAGKLAAVSSMLSGSSSLAAKYNPKYSMWNNRSGSGVAGGSKPWWDISSGPRKF